MILKIEVDGIEGFYKALDQVEREVSDWRAAWAECEKLFYQIEAQQFGSEGSRGGSKWVPLSAKYKRWKELKYPGRPILVRTGEMKASLLGSGGNAIRDLTEDSLTLGSRLPYAKYHQRGGGRLPQRPPIVVTPSDIGQFTRRMLNHMKTVADDSGFTTLGLN